MPIRERETFFNVRVTAADGRIVDYVYKSKHDAERLEAQALKERAAFDVTKGQAFVITTAESLEDIPNVIRDPQVAVRMFNYAVRLYQQGVRGRLMKNASWEGIDGDCDLIEQIQDVKMERHVRAGAADEYAAQRREFKKLYAKKHPGVELPTDAQINRLLMEIFEKQQPPAAAAEVEAEVLQ